MKKLISVTLVTAMIAALLLTGCGKNSAETTASATDAGQGAAADDAGATTDANAKKDGKIVIFQSKVEIMEELNNLGKAYTEATGVEVEIWETSGDNYFSDLKTGLSTNAGPTLFSLQPGAESDQLSDYLEDLSNLSFVNKIGAGMADTVDSKVVGIPYTVEGFGLIYNRSLVDPDEIATMEGLIAKLEAGKGTDVNGLGLSMEDYFLIAHILNAPFAVQEDPDNYLQKVLDGEEKLVENEAFTEFATLMAAIRDNCTNPADVSYDNNCGAFATGKTAMIHQGNWCYSMFADYEVNFDMGISPVPVVGNQKISVSVPTAWYVNADAADDEKALAKDFLEWLYTSETGIDYLMNKFNFIPVVDGMENNNLDPIAKQISSAVVSGDTIPWIMNDWPAGMVSTDLAPITMRFFTSDMTAEDFLEQLNQAFVSAAQ